MDNLNNPVLEGVLITIESIKVPTLFLAGSQDMVIAGADKKALETSMKEAIPLLEEVVLLPEIGHWVQQEAAEETNSILIDFLK